MIGNDEIMEMILPKWLKVIIVLILILAVIGGIDVVGRFINFITR